MKLIPFNENCQFVIDDHNGAHCFSYGQEVAAILDGEYIEYDGPKYYSPTSCKHKAAFRRHFGVTI